MSIIDRSYFEYTEVFIPNAKEDVTDSLLGVKNNLDSFINKYEREILVASLGYKLFNEFNNELDPTQANVLKPTASVKWDELLNGKEYVINDKTVNFRGIRFSDSNFNGNDIYQSFIAHYVYYHYLQDYDQSYSGVGVQKENPSNAFRVSNIKKSVSAWRSFYELMIGEYYSVTYMYNNLNIIGIDYYGCGNRERSLYEFIRDQNSLVSDYYEDWEPTVFYNQNTFGL